MLAKPESIPYGKDLGSWLVIPVRIHLSLGVVNAYTPLSAS